LHEKKIAGKMNLGITRNTTQEVVAVSEIKGKTFLPSFLPSFPFLLAKVGWQQQRQCTVFQ
jgi:hypothetical protein